MKIGFIGAGKVGVSLGKYFTNQNLNVTGFYSKTSLSAREAATFTKTTFFQTLEEVVTSSDILFLTVPDGEIANVWQEISTFSLEGKVICHCSGLHSSKIFEGAQEKGVWVYSIHPLQAIASKTTGYEHLKDAIFSIEGDEQYLPDFQNLFEELGNEVALIDTQAKAKYHAAAVFLSNQVVALAHLGTKLLAESGFEEKHHAKVLQSLFLKNAQNIANKGVVDALTGPVERTDSGTIEKHLQALAPQDQTLYKLLSQQLLEIAEMKHPNIDYHPIKQLLEE